MRIVIQIGYSKAFGRRREGQLIRAWVNDVECEIDPDLGKYITTPVDGKNGKCWFLYDVQVEETDVIRVECKTSIVSAGTDEARTFEVIYYVDENTPVREINVKKVGHHNWPLVKGRIIEMGSISEKDKREEDLDRFLRDGFE